MISLTSVVSMVIYLIIAGLVFWLLKWLIDYINPPEPFKKIADIGLAVAAVLVAIGFLISLTTGQPLFRP